jgi:hypothetical protein
VGHGIGERFQFPVARGEFGGAFLDALRERVVKVLYLQSDPLALGVNLVKPRPGTPDEYGEQDDGRHNHHRQP